MGRGRSVGISTGAAAGLAVALLVVGLVIGALALGPALSPAREVVRTVAQTTTVVRETVRTEVRTVTAPAGLRGEIQIGALLPLTGDLASYGENSRAALELAEREVNDYLRSIGAGFTIRVVVEDTETKPETA
ncbi:MAG: ABC transporter substrate-binding protein, partial [Thaumarchaeota archaeon]|nr:ABC transporter substrate-binding protein [Candidatus Calditenuaceae archaeon]